jgi:hypothetical protein
LAPGRHITTAGGSSLRIVSVIPVERIEEFTSSTVDGIWAVTPLEFAEPA